MLELEQELFALMESRERLIKELEKLDKKIEIQKGLIIHRFTSNNIIVGNLFKLVNVNLESPILLKDLKNILPNTNILFNGVVAKIDYGKTLKMLGSMGLSGLQGQRVVEEIKTLQSDYYKELVLK